MGENKKKNARPLLSTIWFLVSVTAIFAAVNLSFRPHLGWLSSLTESGDHARIGGQCFRKSFNVTTAQIDDVRSRRQVGVGQRRKIAQLCAMEFQQVQRIRKVMMKRVIKGDRHSQIVQRRRAVKDMSGRFPVGCSGQSEE